MRQAPIYEIDPQAFWDDPYPDLARMRAETPIAYVPQLDATLITKRDTIFREEKRIHVFSSDQPGGLMTVLMGENMMRKDGDAHALERRAIFPSVSPRTVRDVWKAQFEAATHDVLDRLETNTEINLVTDYAMPVSAQALKAITGLTAMPFAEMDRVSQGMIDGVGNYAGDPAVVKLAISGGQNEPRDAIAGAVAALLMYPDQLRHVQSGQATWMNVFEEYARWMAPIGMSPRRVAQRDTVDGITFEPETRAFLMFGSGNRDEDIFDAPEVFNVLRDTGRAISFGAGPHFCAGAWASRCLIAEVALPLLFERFPNIDLTQDVRFGGWAFRGPLSVPVRLGVQ